MAESHPPALKRDKSGDGSGPKRSPADDEQRRLGNAALGAGMQFVGAILLFVYLGQWADRKFGTAPWLLLLGLCVGAGGGFYSMYTRLMAANAPPKRPPERSTEEKSDP
jgi:ATP synthase protein I